MTMAKRKVVPIIPVLVLSFGGLFVCFVIAVSCLKVVAPFFAPSNGSERTVAFTELAESPGGYPKILLGEGTEVTIKTDPERGRHATFAGAPLLGRFYIYVEGKDYLDEEVRGWMPLHDLE